MTKEQAKELLPIIQAFAEGKVVERKAKLDNEAKWQVVLLPSFNVNAYDYRIKPEQKYCSFKNREECWEEMQKHQPFGWVKNKKVNDDYYFIDGIYYSENFDCVVASMAGEAFNYKEMMDNYLFADGTPFGIKE